MQEFACNKEGLAGLLGRFDHLADLRRPDRQWFFADQHGCQYSPSWLIAGYHRCCERAGGIAPASTPYTLRHNYATRTLMRWVEEGKDIEAWLPYCGRSRNSVLAMILCSGAVACRGGVHELSRILLRSKEKLARPYIDRLMVLILLTAPSTGPELVV
jgi:hypothetical protein